MVSFPDTLTPPSDRDSIPPMACLYFGRNQTPGDPHLAQEQLTTQGGPWKVSPVHSCMISHLIFQHCTNEENETPPLYLHYLPKITLSMMSHSSNIQSPDSFQNSLHFCTPITLGYVSHMEIPRDPFELKKINGISSLQGRSWLLQTQLYDGYYTSYFSWLERGNVPAL